MEQISGGIRDTSTNKTVIKAKTLLNVSRVKNLDFDVLSLKSPWVENQMIWHKLLKIWQNYLKEHKKVVRQILKDC